MKQKVLTLLAALLVGSAAMAQSWANNCVITQFPYEMDFESDTTCWEFVDFNNNGSTWSLFSTGGDDGNACAVISSSQACNDWLVSPAIATPGTYTLAWAVKGFTSGTSGIILYDVLLVNSATSQTVLLQDNAPTIGYGLKQASFTVAASDTVRIAFRYVANATNRSHSLSIDNVRIRQHALDDNCHLVAFPYVADFTRGDTSCWSYLDGDGDGQTWSYDTAGELTSNSPSASPRYVVDNRMLSPVLALPGYYTVR